MTSKITYLVFGFVLSTALLFGEPSAKLKEGELQQAQISAMIIACASTTLMVDRDNVWKETLGPLFDPDDPTNKVKGDWNMSHRIENLVITRMGKVNDDGVLPVQANMTLLGRYSHEETDPVPIEGVIFKFSKSLDDFGDATYRVDLSRKLGMQGRTSYKLTSDQLKGLMTYFEEKVSKQAAAEKAAADAQAAKLKAAEDAKAAAATAEQAKLAQKAMDEKVSADPASYDRIAVGTKLAGTFLIKMYGDSDVSLTFTEVTKNPDGKVSAKARVDAKVSRKTAIAYTVKGTLDPAGRTMRLEKDQQIQVPFGSSIFGFDGPISIENGKIKWTGMVFGWNGSNFTMVE